MSVGVLSWHRAMRVDVWLYSRILFLESVGVGVRKCRCPLSQCGQRTVQSVESHQRTLASGRGEVEAMVEVK